MKPNDLVIIGSTALVTATLTVTALLPNSLNASGDSGVKGIAQPKLISRGVEFTFAAKQLTFKAGDEPRFGLKAVNTTAKGVDAAVLVTMTAMAPPSPLSRIVSFPRVIWQESCPLTLMPNETKVIYLATDTKLPPNSTIHVKLQPINPQAASANGKASVSSRVKINDPSAIVAMSFSTHAAAPAPALAATQP